MVFIRRVAKFFDKLEDRTRSLLSHWPILYALIGGVGIVLFWRGVWHTADYLSVGSGPWWDGPLSLVISITILLLVGLFVSSFIGDSLILSGLKKDKKLVEKTETELVTDGDVLREMHSEIEEIQVEVEALKHNHKEYHSDLK